MTGPVNGNGRAARLALQIRERTGKPGFELVVGYQDGSAQTYQFDDAGGVIWSALVELQAGLHGESRQAFAQSLWSALEPAESGRSPSTETCDQTTRFSTQRRVDWWTELPVLTSSRVLLRDLKPDDARSLTSMLGAPEVQQHLSPGPATVEEFERFIGWTQRARQAGRYICFGVVPHGHKTPIGVFQLWPLEATFQTAEWGFALGSPFWGTGLFLECARLVTRFAFETVGVQRLEGRSAIENGRGNSALRKLGAVPEGLLRRCFPCSSGATRDHVMWSILAEDWRRGTGCESLR